jgi:hypothetical protein
MASAILYSDPMTQLRSGISSPSLPDNPIDRRGWYESTIYRTAYGGLRCSLGHCRTGWYLPCSLIAGLLLTGRWGNFHSPNFVLGPVSTVADSRFNIIKQLVMLVFWGSYLAVYEGNQHSWIPAISSPSTHANIKKDYFSNHKTINNCFLCCKTMNFLNTFFSSNALHANINTQALLSKLESLPNQAAFPL